MNAHIFGPHMKEKYEQLREQAPEREQQRRREYLAQRGREAGEKLEEMGADFYDPKVGAEYDPEQARTVFAEALAVQEMSARKELGEDLQGDLKKRIEELKKDPVIEKMAGKLPADPDFRNILARSRRKGESPLTAAAEALSKARANGGELPEELRGYSVSDLYAKHGENVRRLAGVLPGAGPYTKEQSVILLANLLAIREQELKSGGRDAMVDDDAFGDRVEELLRDRDVQFLGENLADPKNQALFAGQVEKADDPARLLAVNLYGTYEKRAKKAKPAQEQPEMNDPQADKAQEGPVQEQEPIV